MTHRLAPDLATVRRQRSVRPRRTHRHPRPEDFLHSRTLELAYEAMVFAVRNGTWLVALLLIWAVWESVKAHELTQRWDAKAPQESLAAS